MGRAGKGQILQGEVWSEAQLFGASLPAVPSPGTTLRAWGFVMALLCGCNAKENLCQTAAKKRGLQPALLLKEQWGHGAWPLQDEEERFP